MTKRSKIEENDHFLRLKALTFTENYLQREPSMISDEDIFMAYAVLPEAMVDGIVRGILAQQGIDTEEDEEEFSIPPRHCLRKYMSCTTSILEHIWNKYGATVARQVLGALAMAIRKKITVENERKDPFCKRLQKLVRFFKLSALEVDFLLLRLLQTENLLARSGLSLHVNGIHGAYQEWARWLGTPVQKVYPLAHENANLRRFGLMDEDCDLRPRIVQFLHGLQDDLLRSSFFYRLKGAALPWHFYAEEIRKEGDMICDLIRTHDGKSPLHILLHGAPGTGKSSFARTLASILERPAYAIPPLRMTAKERVDNSAGFRFGALKICEAHTRRQQVFYVVDEAENMLDSGDMFGDPLKCVRNEVLDSIHAPCIWIINSCSVSESTARRFNYSLHFGSMGTLQREKIWQNILHSLKLQDAYSAAEINELAAAYHVSAAGISKTLQSVASLQPADAERMALTRRLLDSHCTLIGKSTAASQSTALQPAADYTLEGLNIQGKVALSTLIEATRRFCQTQKMPSTEPAVDAPRMNILLSGPPGTGKTEFVKYLAAELNVKLILKSASDLTDCRVGNTEKHIRAAFQAAKLENAILFIDELDGMLADRSNAHHSWEVTQVNELLIQMENFGGIFIGATNFMEHVDNAAMRRFTFKLKFDYLTPAGKRHFFQRIFQRNLTAKEGAALDAISPLAPGDFRTVRQSCFYLDVAATTADLLDALAQETTYKRDAAQHRTPLGFAC